MLINSNVRRPAQTTDLYSIFSTLTRSVNKAIRSAAELVSRQAFDRIETIFRVVVPLSTVAAGRDSIAAPTACVSL